MSGWRLAMTNWIAMNSYWANPFSYIKANVGYIYIYIYTFKAYSWICVWWRSHWHIGLYCRRWMRVSGFESGWTNLGNDLFDLGLGFRCSGTHNYKEYLRLRLCNWHQCWLKEKKYIRLAFCIIITINLVRANLLTSENKSPVRLTSNVHLNDRLQHLDVFNWVSL